MTPATDAFRRALMAEAKIPGRGSLFFAIGVVALLALLLIALLAWQSQVSRERGLADARLLVYHHSRLLAERAAAVIEIADLALWQVAEGLAGRGVAATADAVSAARLLRGALPRFPRPSSLSLHDAAGRRVAAAGAVPTLPDVAGQPFFEAHKAVHAGYRVGVEEGPARLRVSRRLEGEGGAFAGVVSALLDPAAFDIARDLEVTRGLDGALLVQPSGAVLAAWPRPLADGPEMPDIAAVAPFSAFPRARLAAAAETETATAAETATEIVELAGAVAAMAPVRNAPFAALAAISNARALAAWRAEWRLTVGAIAVLIAAIGFIALRLGHRHASRREAVMRTLKVLARAVEDSPAMAVIAGPDGTIEYANRTFEEVTGYTREEVVGATPAALAAGHAEPGALDDLWSAVRAGRGWSGEFQARKKAGEAFWLSLSVSPIADARGQITNFAAVGRDISERVENERHRRRTEKAQALRTLVDGIAHEFNNLLTPVLTMTNLAMEGLPEQARERQMLDIASRAAKRARDLVRRVRVFTHDDPAGWQVHDAATLVRDAVAAATAKLPEGIELSLDIAEGLGRLKADTIQIEAAMANLIANAIVAMDGVGGKGGTVTVGLALAGAGPHEGRRPPPGLAAGPHAVISVTDTGEGMPPEVMERIFDPFFSTREVGRGTGLGLSIVQGVATTHGGALSVQSQPGAGSTFSLFLPLMEAAGNGAAENEDTTPDWPQRARR